MASENIRVERKGGKVIVTIPMSDSSHVHVRRAGGSIIISPAIILDADDSRPKSGDLAEGDSIQLKGTESRAQSSITIEGSAGKKDKSIVTLKSKSKHKPLARRYESDEEESPVERVEDPKRLKKSTSSRSKKR